MAGTRDHPLAILRERIRADPDRFVTDFYMRLFATHPELRFLFPANLTHQRMVFNEVFDHILVEMASEGNPGELIEFLAQLGRDHRKFGVTELHYTWFFDTLLAQARDTFGADWSEEALSTTDHVLRLATGVMRGAAHSAPGPPVWHAQVVDKIRPARGLAVIRLITDEPLRFRAGQFLEVMIPQWPGQWRALSPAIPPNPHGELEFHIRGIDGGAVSTAMVTETSVGDRWTLAQSHGTMRVDGSRPVIMVAGGCGLAPLRALILHMARHVDVPPTWFFYATRYPGELYDLANLRALAATNPWLRVVVITESRDNPWWIDPLPTPDDLEIEWLDGLAIDAIVKRGVAETGRWEDHRVLIAGSSSMIEVTRRRLIIAGVPGRFIHHDPY